MRNAFARAGTTLPALGQSARHAPLMEFVVTSIESPED
jgi:hypothetical protein